jgi:hypothetical protein
MEVQLPFAGSHLIPAKTFPLRGKSRSSRYHPLALAARMLHGDDRFQYE